MTPPSVVRARLAQPGTERHLAEILRRAAQPLGTADDRSADGIRRWWDTLAEEV